MDISVVIPLLNEQDSLEELHDWIVSVMQSNQFSYEILFIDDGSSEHSWEVIQKLRNKNTAVLGLKFSKNFGKSQALHAGFAKANGDVVITMDADLQDSPDEIPELYKLLKNKATTLFVVGKRNATIPFLLKIFLQNYLIGRPEKYLVLPFTTFNCGLKAYRKDVVKSIDVYGEMHRYIPVLAVNAGFTNIVEKVVIHQARKYGKTKFGMERFINGFLDLITIWFISKFGRRPMHFFGLLGVIMFMIGLGFASYLGIDKLFLNPSGRLIANRPEFFIALTTMVIGTQFFVAGFLGEIVLQSRQNKERYLVSEATDA